MSKKQELFDCIMSLTPKQADILVQHLDLIKQAIKVGDQENIKALALKMREYDEM